MKNSSSELVYQQIKNEIMFMKLLPGDTVNEVETATRFNVSRTPVRDAFSRLEVEGLIQVLRGLGTFVSLIDIDEIDEIMYMREILETSIIKEIGQTTKSREIELELLLSKQRELLDNSVDYPTLAKEFLQYDNDLHGTIFRLANKTNIWKRIYNDEPHYSRLRVLTNLYSKQELEKLYLEHVQIVDAIIKQNYEPLKELYQDHLYRGMENLASIVNEYPQFFEKHRN